MKRILASIVVKDNRVVNSYGFAKHLPVGNIQYTIERLQEWEVDEIAILNISHTNKPEEDFTSLFDSSLLSKINTPISFGGGITSRESAERIIGAGCERIILSANKLNRNLLEELSSVLGEQALLIHCPFDNYMLEKANPERNEFVILESLSDGWGGELYFKFKAADGLSFESEKLIDFVTSIPEIFRHFIVGGGISEISQVKKILEIDRVAGVAIGNWLNRDELIIPKIKKELAGLNIRNYSGSDLAS